MKKIIGFLIILALAGLLGWQIYQRVSQSRTTTSGGWPGRGGGNAAVAVEIAEVQQRTIQDIGRFTGSLSPKSQFIVAPKMSGRLRQLLVDVGDKVKRNQLIAKLEDDVYRQEAEEAQAELEVAKANLAESQSALEIAKREFERAQTLHQKNILSQAGLDNAQAQYEAAIAKNRVSQALVSNRESRLKTARIRLSYTDILASWETGDEPRVIGERFVDEGTILKVNEPLVSILDLSSISCEINVIERDYFKIQIGQQANIFTDAFPGKTFTGRVARIAPLLKEQSRQASVEIDVPNPDELLKPGMFVRVQIQFDNIENATVVPAAAVVRRDDQQGVFLADLQNMATQFVPVTVGVAQDDLVQIVNPPLSGSVVTMGQYLLEDGASILLPEDGPPGENRGQKKPGGQSAQRE
jgi:RND family efflux transporter MFP subunit